MGHFSSLTGIAVAAFASTNIDDFVMLIALFADPAFRPGPVTAGQFIGMAALIALSILGSLLAFIVPGAWLGLFGLLPIAIGFTRLIRGGTIQEQSMSARRGASNAVTVALLTLSNGGDNLSLYIPLFSIHAAGEVVYFCTVFLALTGVWCAVALSLVRHRNLRLPVPRWTRAILPFAMIALGSYILAKTDALALLLRPFLRLAALI